MMHKNTLYQFLYNTLTAQIHTGRLAYGESLPSIRQLAAMHHVGIRTVKDVLKTMASEGYIQTQERKNAIVVYTIIKEDGQYAVRQLLARRAATQDLYRTVAQLFPSILAHGALLSSQEALQQMVKVGRGIPSLSPKAQWRASSNILRSLIAPYQSPLLVDLCVDLENYGSIPACGGFPSLFDDFNAFMATFPGELCRLVAQNDADSICHAFYHSFTQLAALVEGHLDTLAQQCPQFASQPQTPFVWEAKKGRVKAYLEVARHLILQIGTGAQPDGSLLPSIQQLGRKYGASPTTIMHALAILQDAGLIQTVNGRGSFVTLKAAKTAQYQIVEYSAKQDAYTFLSALQLLILTCRATALLAAPHLTPTQLQVIAAEVNRPNSYTLPDIFLTCIIEALPSASMATIYTQLRGLLAWGFFFSFTRREPAIHAQLQAQCQEALLHLQSGQHLVFSNLLHSVYLTAFLYLKALFLQLGVAEIAFLEAPQSSPMEISH